jgi:hypothetical protein
MVPTIAHALVVALRVVDRGFDDFDKKFKIFIGLSVFGFFLMVVSVFFFIHWIEGIICLVVLILLLWVAV